MSHVMFTKFLCDNFHLREVLIMSYENIVTNV